MSLFSDLNQLKVIIDVIGFPSDELLNSFNEDTREFLMILPAKPECVDFTTYFDYIKNPNGNCGSYFF